MKFRLIVGLGNEAMQTPLDAAAMLRNLADALDARERWDGDAGDSGTIRDDNGNTVGRWEVAA